MRNPNGYGGIVKMKGNRRKPYRVRVTVGYEYDKNGHSRQVQKTLGTYATYQEAVDALAEYNRSPIALDSEITFSEVFRQYCQRNARYFSPNTVSAYTSAFSAMTSLHNCNFQKLRRADLQKALDGSGRGFSMLTTMKAVLRGMYKYAQKNDIVDRDYSRDVDIEKYKPTKEQKKTQVKIHKSLTKEEIDVLWSHDSDPFVRKILMLCYSGLRISEFLYLTPEDIDVETRIIALESSKTHAGVRRVPIAEKTVKMWEEYRSEMIEDTRPYISQYQSFADAFNDKMQELNLPSHLPHDTRYTASTLMHRAKIDLLVRKRILGHKVTDITEGTYTDVSDAEIIDAINQI